jgi:hypothetical protein
VLVRPLSCNGTQSIADESDHGRVLRDVFRVEVIRVHAGAVLLIGLGFRHTDLRTASLLSSSL